MIPKASLPPVMHNADLQRFEMQTEGHLAFTSYTPEGDRVIFEHTDVPTRFAEGGWPRYWSEPH